MGRDFAVRLDSEAKGGSLVTTMGGRHKRFAVIDFSARTNHSGQRLCHRSAMRTALLVLAYRGLDIFKTVLPYYLAAGCDVFVHVDRKVSGRAFREALGPLGDKIFFVEDPLEIFWGGYSMVLAEFKLIELASSRIRYDRYVLVSDDSVPIHSPKILTEYFATDFDFIEINRQEEGSGFYKRYSGFFFFDHPATDARRLESALNGLDDKFFNWMAKVLQFRKTGKKKIPISWGSQFWSLTAGTLETVSKTIRNDPDLVMGFATSAIPDELLFQSIIEWNKEKLKLQSGPMYADWTASPGPRTYMTIDEIPYDFMPYHLFLRKIGPSAKPLINTLASNLEAGRSLYKLRTDPSHVAEHYFDAEGGASINVLTLAAPEDPAGGTTEWHGIERAGLARFRWTASNRIEWHRPSLKGSAPLRIVIPLFMTVKPDFAKACQICIGNQTRPVSERGRALFADFGQLDATDDHIVLLTPAPVSPNELTGWPDWRRMGLAIRATDTPL